MRTSEKPFKLYIILKVLTKNANFIKFEQKVVGIKFKVKCGAFTKSTHQIWLSDMTPDVHSEYL